MNRWDGNVHYTLVSPRCSTRLISRRAMRVRADNLWHEGVDVRMPPGVDFDIRDILAASTQEPFYMMCHVLSMIVAQTDRHIECLGTREHRHQTRASGWTHVVSVGDSTL